MKKIIFFLSVTLLALSCSSDSDGEKVEEAVLPQLTTLAPVFAAGKTTFGGNVTVAGDGYSNVGVCWGIDANPTVNGQQNVTTFGNGQTGNFSLDAQFSDLLQFSKTYHARAYVVTNDSQIVYGNDVLFTTPDFANAKVEAVKEIYTTSATAYSSIQIFDLSIYEVTQKGFCYRTSPNVTIQNGTLKVIDDSFLNAEFESELLSLTSNTTYYIKSYIVEGGKVYYSPETSFKTAGGIGVSGGHIFYDKGEVTDGWRYLEAAPANLIYNGTNKILWGCLDLKVNQTQSTLGSGAANTARIVSQCANANCAARLCDNFTINGLNDWFLGSEDEMMIFYKSSINVYNIATNPWNDVSDKYFWTSTESGNASEARILDAYSGYTWQYVKNYGLVRVRPIRRF